MSKDALESLSREDLIALVERERETFAAHQATLAVQAESHAKTIRQLEQTYETLTAQLESQTQAIEELRRKEEQLEHRLALVL